MSHLLKEEIKNRHPDHAENTADKTDQNGDEIDRQIQTEIRSDRNQKEKENETGKTVAEDFKNRMYRAEENPDHHRNDAENQKKRKDLFREKVNSSAE